MPPIKGRKEGTVSHRRPGLLFPGHNYLGPGNPVDGAEPVDVDDEIARRHDEWYNSARSPSDISNADFASAGEFLEDLFRSGNWHSAVGAAGLYSKWATEKLLGVQYPKSFPAESSRGESSGSASSSSNGRQLSHPADIVDMAGSGHRKRAASFGGDPDSSKRRADDDGSGPSRREMDAGEAGEEGSVQQGGTDGGVNRQKRSTGSGAGGAEDGAMGPRNQGAAEEAPLAVIRSLGTLGVNFIVKNRFLVKSWGMALKQCRNPTSSKGGLMSTPMMALPCANVSMYVSPAEYDRFPVGTVVQYAKVSCSLQGREVSFAVGGQLAGYATAQHVQFGIQSDDLRWKGYQMGSYTVSADSPMVPVNYVDWSDADWARRRWGFEDAQGEACMADGVVRHCGNYWAQRAPFQEQAVANNRRQLTKDATIGPISLMENKVCELFSFKPRHGVIKGLPQHAQLSAHFDISQGEGGRYSNDGIRTARASASRNMFGAIPEKYSLSYTCPTFGFKQQKIDMPHVTRVRDHDGMYVPDYPMKGVGIMPILANQPNADNQSYVNCCAIWSIETEMHCSIMMNSDYNMLYMWGPNDQLLFPNNFNAFENYYSPDSTLFGAREGEAKVTPGRVVTREVMSAGPAVTGKVKLPRAVQTSTTPFHPKYDTDGESDSEESGSVEETPKTPKPNPAAVNAARKLFAPKKA